MTTVFFKTAPISTGMMTLFDVRGLYVRRLNVRGLYVRGLFIRGLFLSGPAIYLYRDGYADSNVVTVSIEYMF